MPLFGNKNAAGPHKRSSGSNVAAGFLGGKALAAAAVGAGYLIGKGAGAKVAKSAVTKAATMRAAAKASKAPLKLTYKKKV